MDEHAQILGIIRSKNASPLELDPKRTALLVVDMQRYFTQPSHAFTDLFETLSPGAARGYLARVREIVVPAIHKLLQAFRAGGGPVVFTAVGTESGDGRELPHWLRSLDQLGLAVVGKRVWPPITDPSWAIDDALRPLPHEVVLNKLSAGAFA
ncbi:MAG TPA: isochorismatase family protein, partial [Gemmatimonadales bacterium]|nr:isochorismatase family protein [Gemmatimonadales bacterium]